MWCCLLRFGKFNAWRVGGFICSLFEGYLLKIAWNCYSAIHLQEQNPPLEIFSLITIFYVPCLDQCRRSGSEWIRILTRIRITVEGKAWSGSALESKFRRFRGPEYIREGLSTLPIEAWKLKMELWRACTVYVHSYNDRKFAAIWLGKGYGSSLKWKAGSRSGFTLD